jgi:hypothetical protein
LNIFIKCNTNKELETVIPLERSSMTIVQSETGTFIDKIFLTTGKIAGVSVSTAHIAMPGKRRDATKKLFQLPHLYYPKDMFRESPNVTSDYTTIQTTSYKYSLTVVTEVK